MRGKKQKEPAGMNCDEIFTALEMIEKERNIPQSFMLDKIVQALTTAYKRDCKDQVDNVIVDVDLEHRTLQMFVQKNVVDEEDYVDPFNEVPLDEAKKLSAKYEIGDVINVPVDNTDFGRIAAGNGKQVIIQGLREAERGMPQTVESINHAKAAGIPVVVAINKIDKPNANPEKVKQQLTEYGLLTEDWGGDTICCPISAKKNIGIDKLLEMVILTAEMAELKANPNRAASGTVIEARLDKGRGPIATLLVQNGTLKQGDTIIAGTAVGRVRTMVAAPYFFVIATGGYFSWRTPAERSILWQAIASAESTKRSRASWRPRYAV